ncbi:MAG: preprotein translocase subunit YajC [Verrucomicrobiales bacterium]|nr:preprotein translocase subunit YajC [Verrucomicrobiales bacterium]
MDRVMTFARRAWLVLTLAVVTGCLPPPGQQGQGGQPVDPKAEMIKMLGMMVIFFIIMWVLLIRPQQKKQREHDEMVKQLKAGDKVVANGMVGTIVSVRGNKVTVRSGDSKFEMLSYAVSEVYEDEPKGEKD